MLKFPQKRFKWSGRAQSGFYFDFIFKKLGEVFIRNVFVFAALFLGEKYMIEHLTKKVVDSFVFNSNRFTGWTSLNFMLFFYFLLVVVLYLLVLINLIYLFI
jgi:hypothetical protein